MEIQKKIDWMKVTLVICILVFITINSYVIADKFGNKTIEYRDRMITEKEACLINCTQIGNVIQCSVPNNKTLEIKRIELYNTTLK